MRHARPTAALALTALAATASLVLAGGAAAQSAPAAAPAADLPPTVHTAGRVSPVDGGLAFSWPGVYFEGRFRGTGVGVVLDDAVADYDVAVDGRRVATWVAPGRGTRWVTGLTDGEHTVRVVKRSESTWATSTFGGFVPVAGGALLAAPAPRDLQLEFLGDSYTAGYGNESTTRECTGDEVHRTTNADLSFGALTARALDADYQVNAFSGRGMVRNYGGGEPGTSYRTYADRALLAVPGDVWQRPAGWQPDAVVVGLGINDFSTPVGAGEPWTTTTLRTAYVAAYDAFVASLRARYGPDTFLVLGAPDTAPDVVTLTREVAAGHVDRGDDRVVPWVYGGLDLGGCHWHPSLADHRAIAGRLTALLRSLPLGDGTGPTPTATPTPGPTGTPTPSPSVTPSGTPSPTPTPTPGFPAATCTATLTVASRWPGGYQATVDVTAGTRPVGGWRATFDLPSGGTVAHGWSGAFSTSGATVTVRNAAWNGALAAGRTTTAGFIGAGTPPTGPVACSAL